MLVDLPDGRRLPYWCEVTGLDAPFGIGRILVTNELYKRFDPGHRKEQTIVNKVPAKELAYHSVVRVSWYEAVAFSRWVAQGNPGVRLPLEREWQHAATPLDGGQSNPFGSATRTTPRPRPTSSR